MEKHVVEIATYAVVRTKVIVEASSKAEAIKKAENVDNEQVGITDIDGNAVEGIGDLVWKYDGMDEDSVDDYGGFDGMYSHALPEGKARE